MPKPAYYALCQCVILQLRHFPGLNMDSKSRFILWNVFAQKKNYNFVVLPHWYIIPSQFAEENLFVSINGLPCVFHAVSWISQLYHTWKIENEIWTKQLKTRKSTTKKHQVELLFGKVIIWFKLVVLFILCCLCVFCQIMNTNKAGYLNSWKPN